MKVDLNYGYTSISLDIPHKNLVQVIEPWKQPQVDNAEVVAGTLQCEKWEKFGAESARRRLCILLPDSSRDMPLKDILPKLLPPLGECARVDFIICTGTHQAQTPQNIAVLENVRRTAEKAGLRRCRFHIHDAQGDRLVHAGRTARGTEVYFNSFIEEAEVFIVLSDVKVHYFAGYSNPIKYFAPGICAFETAEKNHIR
jgi:nickel-dependent lactate racemase